MGTTLRASKWCGAHDDGIKPTRGLREFPGDYEASCSNRKVEQYPAFHGAALVVAGELHDKWISERMHPSLGEDVYYLLKVDWSPLRSACGFRVTMDRIADLTLEAGRQHGNCEKSAPVESRHRRPVAGSFEPVVPTLCRGPTHGARRPKIPLLKVTPAEAMTLRCHLDK